MSTIKDTIKRVIIPINSEGYGIIVIMAVAVAILSIIWDILAIILFILLAFTIYFFRDPIRVINNEENTLVAPADGVIDAIEEIAPPAELEMSFVLAPVCLSRAAYRS